MKHLLFFLPLFPFFASAQILEKQFVATVQYSGFTQINDSLYRGDLIEFRDVLIEGYQPSGVDSGFICLDGTGRAYRVEVINSFDYSSLNVDLIELDDYDEIPIGVGIVAERYGSTYQIPNGLVNSIGISSVLQAKILNHNTKIAATTVQPPDTLYIQELSGTTAISNGDTIPLIDYVRVVDTPAMLLNYPSTAGYGIIDGGKTWRADTTSPNGLATRLFTNRFALGTGTTDRSARWSGTNTLAAGNITDNGTKLEALLPWQFQSVTTAGRPTGVSAYIIDNSTNDWFERYSTVAGAWISPLQSSLTGGKGTATRVLFNDANGRATDNANLTFNGNSLLFNGSATALVSWTSMGGSSKAGLSWLKSGAYASSLIADNTTGDLVYNDENSGSAVERFRVTRNTGAVTIRGYLISGNLQLGLTTALPVPIILSQRFPGTTKGDALYFQTFRGNGGGIHTRLLITSSDLSTGNPGVADVIVRDANLIVENQKLGIKKASPVYDFDMTSTDALGLARGAVSTRPTIVASTTPLRYDTDSTALEYGESVGVWRLIATRDYARSLVTGLGSGTVASVGLSLPSIFSVSGSPVTTSGTLSATFTGGTASQFLRGDGRWMKSLYFNSSDSIQFNSTDPYFGGTTLMSAKGSSGSFDSRFNVANYGYVNQALAIATVDDARYIFDRARGTIASPTALLKDDRIGGIYFNAHNGTSYRKTGYIGAVVDSIHSGANPQSKLIFGTSEVNSPEISSYWRFLVEATRNLSVVDHVIGRNFGVGFGASITVLEAATVDARLHVKGTGTTTDKTMLLEDSGGADILTITDNKTIQTHGYGTGAKEASDLSKTQSNFNATFATDGTIIEREQKRDTTIYVIDTDYDFSAAVTTTQVGNRYNRVIFLMTTTAAAGSDSELTLHTPDANLMQVEYLVRSTDEAGGFANKIVFGTNNAVDSTNGLVTNYFPAAGQGVGIRAGLRSAAYKYFYY